MTVKKILGECLIKMGQEDFTAKTEYDGGEQQLVAALLGALNIVYREIICEYLPLVTKERVLFMGNALDVKSINFPILYPIKLTANGKDIDFKVYPTKILADYNGAAELEYAYIPQNDLKIDDQIEDVRIPPSAFTDGILGRYYFANKIFDLASDFDSSYRSKITALRYKGRKLMLKPRGWDE